MKIIFTAEETSEMINVAQAIIGVIKEVKPDVDEAEIMSTLMGDPLTMDDGTFVVEYNPSIIIAMCKTFTLLTDKIKPLIKPVVTLFSAFGTEANEIWKDVKGDIKVNDVDMEEAKIHRENFVLDIDCNGEPHKLLVARKHQLADVFIQWASTSPKLQMTIVSGTATITNTEDLWELLSVPAEEMRVKLDDENVKRFRLEKPRLITPDGEIEVRLSSAYADHVTGYAH